MFTLFLIRAQSVREAERSRVGGAISNRLATICITFNFCCCGRQRIREYYTVVSKTNKAEKEKQWQRKWRQWANYWWWWRMCLFVNVDKKESQRDDVRCEQRHCFTHTANSVLLALIEQLTTQESAVQQKNRTSSLSTALNRWQMRQSWWWRLQLPTKARALSPSSDVSVVFKVQAQFAFDDLSMKKKMVQSGRRGGGGKKGNRKRRRRWRWCDRNCLCERDGNRNLKWWMIDLCRRVRLCHTKCHW